MATIKESGQSYLEAQGQEARLLQTARADYNSNNEYNERHPDALADGDGQGKGTGDFQGHGWSVPDMTKPKDEMAYGNFNTSDGGNDCDHSAREVMTNRSIYGPGREYGRDIIPDTSLNVSDGQFNNAGRTKIAYICPVV